LIDSALETFFLSSLKDGFSPLLGKGMLYILMPFIYDEIGWLHLAPPPLTPPGRGIKN
jgi:hypothetical protein